MSKCEVGIFSDIHFGAEPQNISKKFYKRILELQAEFKLNAINIMLETMGDLKDNAL